MYFSSLWQDDAADQTTFNKSIYNVQDLTDGTKQNFDTKSQRLQILQIHGAMVHTKRNGNG